MAKPTITVKNLGAIRAAATPKGFHVAEAFDDLKSALENIAIQLAAQPNGSILTPPDISSMSVQVSGALVDVSIVDNGAIGRAIGYHVEYDTVASFSNPRGMDFGSWRTGTMVLPNGTFYFRAYSQYSAGGPPSNPVNYVNNPVVIGASVVLALLPSQGSGTGEPNMGGGEGAGKQLGREGFLSDL